MLRRSQTVPVLAGALLALSLAVAPGGAQITSKAPATANPAPASTLTVAGAVRTPLTLSIDDLKGMARHRVDLKNERGGSVSYEGVLLADVLKRAGAPLGTDLRGAAFASYVIVTASDGYRVVFSLAELDPDLSGSEIIVADTADGHPLEASQGPFRVVVPRDAKPARSVRMVQRLEVAQLPRQ